MRPLIVLSLVLIAAAALVFTFLFRTEERKSPEILDPGRTEVAAPVDPGPIIDLTKTPDERVAVPVVPEDLPEAPVEEATLADFENGLTGQVTDEQGKPITQASVTLTFANTQIMLLDTTPNTTKNVELVTDDQGRFTFLHLEPSDFYTLIVSHPEYSRDEISNVQVPIDGIAEEPAIVLRKGSQLSGYIRDKEGVPITQAEIILDVNPMGPVGKNAQRAKIDNAGKYTIDNVAPGMRTLRVMADGYGSQFHGGLSFDGKNSRTKDIELEVAAIIAGRVLNPDGDGEPGVQVMAINYSNSTRHSRDSMKTGADGSFSLERLNPGSYTLQFAKHGFKRDRMLRVETGDLNVTFQLARRAIVSGNVVDAGTGKPVPAGTVTLRQTMEGTELTTRTNISAKFKNGKYELMDVQGGDYLVEAIAPEYGLAATFSTPFTVIEGQDMSNIDVSLTSGGKITGRVVDNEGKPVKGALVGTHENDFTTEEFFATFGEMFPNNITPQKVRTAKDGSFTISGVRPDIYQVTADADGFMTWRKRHVKLTEGATYDLGDVRLSKGGTVTGILFDSAGAPIAGGMVRLQPQMVPQGGTSPTIRRPYMAKANAKGSFTISNVVPGGYTLAAAGSSSSTANPFLNIKQSKESSAKINVQEGRVSSQDLTMP